MLHGSPIEQANRLFAQKRPADGLALLKRAAKEGNVDALMQLAVFDFAGSHGARDLPRGRKWLRRAVEIGHVDGALMEVALVANGSGQAHPDWTGALALLRTAAQGDPVAAEQLELVERMSVDGQGRPDALPKGEPLSKTPHVVRYRALFSPAECAQVAAVAGPMLEPSAIVDPSTGTLRPHPVRTAMAAVIGPAKESLVIRAINHRLAAVTGTSTEQGEPLSVMRYDISQQYRMHIDALPGTANQRIKTAIIYLNHGYEGGETLFEHGPKIAGQQGDVIVFDNVRSDGSPDPLSRHAGLPIVRGVKWIATRWIREADYDPWTYRPGT
ncbi:Prolyl 4-hydroxylase alpha subunit [Sphingopyxis fribergensis]|uniref:Prolyl 4-hydroxylase alpha subunit n=1 Tax=Sphingopyxis fribergensis TaxID=1515612 RepID=A0A0A7PFD7_9SPHN|nr:2OG-Fe(II) oxygenase [Sphingopyxis fribergensis]AJA08690.1 Prolyl 4-hydroxylase alpha subunit [Sphingopyxis fribergensis]